MARDFYAVLALSRSASEDQIQQMVAAGLGVALAAARQPVAPGLVARPLAGAGVELDSFCAIARAF